MIFKIIPRLILLVGMFGACYGQTVPLRSAFAHNDYLHKKPLYDALENGFTNIEVDIFLHHNQLIVAHYFPYFKSKRTLESLYLKPLQEYVSNNNGSVYKGYLNPIILMIDIKSGSEKTYDILNPLLAKYSSMLTSVNNGVVKPGLITVVLSGHNALDQCQSDSDRYVFFDNELSKEKSNLKSAYLYVMSSCKYSRLLKWKGKGEISEGEKETLKNAIDVAHARGEKVRLYASPENNKIWSYLLNAGVDFINTDKLAKLKGYLLTDNHPKELN